MSSKAGLWIDHRRAFIVHVTEDETRTETIDSNVEKHVRDAGGSRSSTPYGPQDIAAGDRVDRKYRGHLERYYEEVARAVREAESVYILGPGEAKTELRKHLEKTKRTPPVRITIETADKMTEAQITAKVREHFIH